MKLKVISDGSPKGTAVVDVDKGVPLENVKSVKLDMDANEVTATIVVANVQADIRAVGTVKKAPAKK